jgi:hypothetical protein
MSLVISFIIIFFIYTCRFKIIISQSTEAPIKNHIRELKKTMYTNKFTYVPNIEIDDNDIKEFLKDADAKGNLYLIKKYIVDVDTEGKGDELTDYDMELEDEFINVDLNYNHDNPIDARKNQKDDTEGDVELAHTEQMKTPIKKIVSLASVRDRDVSLKKNDINVLNKVGISA